VQERAAVAISTQHFFASFGAFQDARICLIRLCNMRVYTRASDLAAVLVGTASFVGDAVFRAGNGGCVLAIQHYCAVQA
jgi:hypothetical protein